MEIEKQKNKEKMKTYSSIALAIILIIISIIIRIPKEEEEFYSNSDATYHTLLTMKCYDETPISVHKFLPIVSLGDEEDKNISWGTCRMDNEGNYYYTSFSPVGFVAPYIFVKIFNLPINIYSLYAFNSIICIATLTLMIIIFCKLFSKYISHNYIIILTTLIYLFSMEVMHSQGVIFWVHSISQLLILIHFFLFMNYENKKSRIAFYIMCVIMPYVEWTGYVSNVAFAIILFIKDVAKNKKVTLKSFIKPILIGTLTILSFIIFSMHFLMNLSFNDYIYTLRDRFFARNISASTVKINDLLNGYNISYRYVNILCAIMILITLSIKKFRKKLWELVKEYKYEIIFFAFILLENLIMLEHAVTYSFDRLKLAYILIIMFYIIISALSIVKSKIRKILINSITIILVVISILNIKDYKKLENYYVYKNGFYKNNKIISTYVNEKFNHENSIIATNGGVRGYFNLLFNRGIYEHKEYEQAKQLAINKNKRYLVYLNSYGATFVEYAIILDTEENSQYKIHSNNNEIVIENI